MHAELPDLASRVAGRGRPPVLASSHDPRFSYCLSAPEKVGAEGAPLVVIQRGCTATPREVGN